MADWREQYLAALEDRDKIEKANLELYEYCTKLADEKALLVKKHSTSNPAEQDANLAPTSSPPPPLVGRGWLGSPPPPTPGARPDSPKLAQLRSELAKAQQERTDLSSRLDKALKELATLQTKALNSEKRLSQLTSQVSQLQIKLRDREEELKGKAKLVEGVQDENMMLGLEVKMAEEQRAKVEKENQELVKRWMEKMGKEAERMNLEHESGKEGR